MTTWVQYTMMCWIKLDKYFTVEDIWDDCFTGRKVYSCVLSSQNKQLILKKSKRISISVAYISNIFKKHLYQYKTKKLNIFFNLTSKNTHNICL